MVASVASHLRLRQAALGLRRSRDNALLARAPSWPSCTLSTTMTVM